MKKLTFSFDDGIEQDVRLIELFSKYGMKGTFNLNSGRFGMQFPFEYKGRRIERNLVRADEVKARYQGHEIAVHTLTHPNLTELSDDWEVVRQVEQDRIALSELCGYEVKGMAYPCGGVNHDERVMKLIRKHTGVNYARTVTSSHNFAPPTNLLEWNPSAYITQMDKLFELGEAFLKQQTDCTQIFYIWGHSYEFDMHESWGQFEEFLQMMSNRDDIVYCTNGECF